MTESDKMTQEPDIITLRVVRGPAVGAELVVQGPGQILGRTRVARQIQLKDPNVSERHAEISWDGSSWTLRDLGSSNGTELNDQTLERQGEAVPLHNGDTICFGGQSQVDVEIAPTPNTDQTVEQYLLAETERLAEAIRARARQKSNELRNQWLHLRKPLFA